MARRFYPKFFLTIGDWTVRWRGQTPSLCKARVQLLRLPRAWPLRLTALARPGIARVEARPLAAQSLPRVLELAAFKVTDAAACSCSHRTQVRLWNEELRSPIMTSKYFKNYVLDATWSPTRPGVFLSTKMDGTLDVWDYFYKQNDPTLSLQIDDDGLFSVAMQVRREYTESR